MDHNVVRVSVSDSLYVTVRFEKAWDVVKANLSPSQNLSASEGNPLRKDAIGLKKVNPLVLFWGSVMNRC